MASVKATVMALMEMDCKQDRAEASSITMQARAYISRNGMPKDQSKLVYHTFVDYVEDLIAIQPVRWLLDVIDPLAVSFRSSSMHAQQNAIAAGAEIGLLPLFSAKRNPSLLPILPDAIQVHRDVYLSVHEDLEFLARVRSVIQYLGKVFQRDIAYLNDI